MYVWVECIYIWVDIFPAIATIDALVQGLLARHDISIEDLVEIDRGATSSDHLVAQLKLHNYFIMISMMNKIVLICTFRNMAVRRSRVL